jgi:hypothetical protein
LVFLLDYAVRDQRERQPGEDHQQARDRGHVPLRQDELLPFLDHRSPVRSRCRDAQTEVSQGHDRQQGEHDVAHREDDRLEDHVRQYVPQQDAPGRQAAGPGRHRVFLLLDDQYLTAHDPAVRHPADQGDRRVDAGGSRPHREDQGDHQDQEGERDHYVDDPADDRVDPAAEPARDQTDQTADDEG